ncbi:MAG: hypothetical protein ACI9KE_006463 [Polyangiales bacterium]|jgi:hypothetical protein
MRGPLYDATRCVTPISVTLRLSTIGTPALVVLEASPLWRAGRQATGFKSRCPDRERSPNVDVARCRNLRFPEGVPRAGAVARVSPAIGPGCTASSLRNARRTGELWVHGSYERHQRLIGHAQLQPRVSTHVIGESGIWWADTTSVRKTNSASSTTNPLPSNPHQASKSFSKSFYFIPKLRIRT